MGNTPSQLEGSSKSKTAESADTKGMNDNLKDVSMVDVSEAGVSKSDESLGKNNDGNLAVMDDAQRQSHFLKFSQMSISSFDEQGQQGSHNEGETVESGKPTDSIGIPQRRSTTLLFDYDDDLGSLKQSGPAGNYSNSDVESINDQQVLPDQQVSSRSSSMSPTPQVGFTGASSNDNKLEGSSEAVFPSVGGTSTQQHEQIQHDSQVEAQVQTHASGQPSVQAQPIPQLAQQHAKETIDKAPAMVPVDITWQQGGSKVYVTGSFTGWRKMIGLIPDPNHQGMFHIKLQLPPGTHRFRFIVDNELRFSDYLPTATDQMGNFVNYLEIVSPLRSQSQGQQQPAGEAQNLQYPQKHSLDNDSKLHATFLQTSDGKISERSKLALQIEEDPDDMGDGYSRFKEETKAKPTYEFIQDIPAVFTDPSVMGQYYLTLDQQQNNQQNLAWLNPPQLPPHLEHVILNQYSKSADGASENTSGALPIPNHVVLNHLATSSIKHNTLCVASIVRYKRKYATQILYAPLQ